MNLFNGLNTIGEDSYFIRLVDNPEYFLHYLPAGPKSESRYEVMKGSVGAAVWHKESGQLFIKHHNIGNAELVKVSDILENDGSKN